MKAPFPWFGGKSKVSELVWQRFGDVPNYVEPFFGSGAVLLNRPHEPKTETVNDIDGYLANFWRALQHAPDEVARWGGNPIHENDLHARHIWLVNQKAGFVPRLEGDPDYYDVKIAGWWVWGICAWIGSGWCSGKGPWQVVERQLVNLNDNEQGIWRKRPHLGDNGQGVNRQRVHLIEYFNQLANRLRNVRVCCGDWSRVCGSSVTFNHGLTGVFLDPPYSADAGRDNDLYTHDDLNVGHDVREWAIENGNNPLMRIALCGYEDEHEMPTDWECVAWKANGGLSNQNGNGNNNATKERIWFSPHCLKPDRQMTFDELLAV